jgi:hypothetical protein
MPCAGTRPRHSEVGATMSGRVRRGRHWLAAWAIMFCVWMLLVGSTDAIELTGGVFGAAIAATGLALVQARDNVLLIIRPSWLLILLRMGQPVGGHVLRFGFDAGSPDDPYAAGRRALVVVGVSLAPNAVVVRIDGTDLIVHQLLAAPAPQDREWPL